MNDIRKLKLLAGLDLSDMDRYLIRYIPLLEQWLPLASITFLHNIKLSELPEDLKNPDRLQTIATRIENRCRQLIQETPLPGVEFKVKVTYTEYSEMAFTETVRQEKTDLVLLGNKQQLEGSGGLSQKLIRMIPAAVLLAPETAASLPLHVVTAIDFSKYTPAVVQWGRLVSRQLAGKTGFRLSPVYISKMTYHFFPIFSDEEVAASLRQEGTERSRRWKEQFPEAPPLQIIPAQDKSIATTLLEFAGSGQAGLIIMGVKGASSITNLFMGSVANEMVQRETPQCLLFVKQR